MINRKLTTILAAIALVAMMVFAQVGMSDDTAEAGKKNKDGGGYSETGGPNGFWD